MEFALQHSNLFLRFYLNPHLYHKTKKCTTCHCNQHATAQHASVNGDTTVPLLAQRTLPSAVEQRERQPSHLPFSAPESHERLQAERCSKPPQSAIDRSHTPCPSQYPTNKNRTVLDLAISAAIRSHNRVISLGNRRIHEEVLL